MRQQGFNLKHAPLSHHLDGASLFPLNPSSVRLEHVYVVEPEHDLRTVCIHADGSLPARHTRPSGESTPSS